MTLVQCAAPPQNPCTKMIVGVVDIRFAPVEVLCAMSTGAAPALVIARPALAISSMRRESRYLALSHSFMGQLQPGRIAPSPPAPCGTKRTSNGCAEKDRFDQAHGWHGVRFVQTFMIRAAALRRSRRRSVGGAGGDGSARSASGVLPVADLIKRRKLRESA